MLFLIFLFSFLITFFAFPVVIPRLKRAGITGKNMNSEKQEEIPEMGGLVMIAGFSAGMILTIFLKVFFEYFTTASLVSFLACLSTVLIVALIGIFDDLISIKQSFKAFMPVFAALPLMAVKSGFSYLRIPFLGIVEFGIVYPLLIIPLGLTGATNAFNMLAGFNGLEAGLGMICMISVSIIAYLTGSMTSLVIALSCLGAIVATLYYNWYPAKILVGDIGTLFMGSVLAVCVIVGNFETAGAILIIPYVIDFIIKSKHHFPYTFGEYRNGKLNCPQDGPKGLVHVIMKISGGITEKNLVLVLMIIEAVFGVLAILVYW